MKRRWRRLQQLQQQHSQEPHGLQTPAAAQVQPSCRLWQQGQQQQLSLLACSGSMRQSPLGAVGCRRLSLSQL